MRQNDFAEVEDVSKIPEGATVRVGKPDPIHRPNGRATGELLENDIKNGVFHVATDAGYQPFSTSDQAGYVSAQGAEGNNEKVYVNEGDMEAVEDDQSDETADVGDVVELTADVSHHNLGKTWEVLTTNGSNVTLTDGRGVDTIRVSSDKITEV